MDGKVLRALLMSGGLVLAAWIGIASAGWAQTEGQMPSVSSTPVAPVEKTVTTAPGIETRIGVYVNIKPDCTSGPLPTIRVMTSPQHGSVVVKRARLQMTNVGSCLSLTVPGYAAFYRARPDYSGTDNVSLQITNDAGGTQLQTFNVIVKVATQTL